MTVKQNYGGAIWTNHAIERLYQRQLPQDLAWQAFHNPDETKEGKMGGGTKEYRKRVGQSLITIVAKQNERREWIILSCWIDPPLPGTVDAKKKADYKKFRKQYRKASNWGKFFLEFKRQLGF